MSAPFLDESALRKLTGRKLKSHQIKWLRSAGIPFWVNATGHPVVSSAVLSGNITPPPPAQPQRWTPRVVGA